MNLGFIGTGNIVSDVVIGISKSKIRYKNGSVESVIERYDFNGNPLPL